MRSLRRVSRVLAQAVLISATCTLVAQGHHGRDHDNGPHGHDGMAPGQAKKHDREMPPGQAKKYGDDEGRMPPGQAKKHGDEGRGMPPGQAKKYGDWRFRGEDRDQFYRHYRADAEHWRGRRRAVFIPGQYVPSGYYVRAVPQSYWVGMVPPPPAGCRYGYYEGYVVAYNPTTRIIADTIDLIGAVTGH